MVYGLYVIYYGVCFVCGTMVTTSTCTVHVHTCVLLSHLCTTVNYCTHLCTSVHTCVQLYTVQYTLVYTRTCILYKCPNVVARHLWSAHVVGNEGERNIDGELALVDGVVNTVR